jgi:hypothetical protein
MKIIFDYIRSLIKLLNSMIIRVRLFQLILLGFIIKYIKIPFYLIQVFLRFIHVFCAISSEKRDSLHNQNNNIRDYYHPDIDDVFHIYLSKLLYESRDQIIKQCIKWGFNKESIYILRNNPDDNPYSIQAVIINDEESNRIIIAFQGTEPMGLVQRMTDASRNLIDINKVVNGTNDKNNKILIDARFYYALGFDQFNSSQSIDFDDVTSDSPMFIQLLYCLQKLHRKNEEYKISLTGHGLGGGLASVFSFILLSYGYDESISAVYPYDQPSIGNCNFAEIIHYKLGKRIHLWINYYDLITRIRTSDLVTTPIYIDRRLNTVAIH